MFQPDLLPSNHSNPVFAPGKSWGSEYAGNQPNFMGVLGFQLKPLWFHNNHSEPQRAISPDLLLWLWYGLPYQKKLGRNSSLCRDMVTIVKAVRSGGAFKRN